MKKQLYTLVGFFLLLSGLALADGLDPFPAAGSQTVTMNPYSPEWMNPGEEPFRVYPNPVRDELKVAVTLDEPAKVVLEIRDITGKKVMEENLEQLDGESEIPLNLSSLRRGIYFMKFFSQDKKIYQIIKIQKL